MSGGGGVAVSGPPAIATCLMGVKRLLAAALAAFVLLGTAGCSTAWPSDGAGLYEVDEGQAIQDGLTAPTTQIFNALIIADWAKFGVLAEEACLGSMSGEGRDWTAEWDEIAAGYESAHTSLAGTGNAAPAGYPATVPDWPQTRAPGAGWCEVSSLLRAERASAANG